jgi:GT2 family glycosyltransferase
VIRADGRQTHGMRVAAVVVNWNGGEENLACIASLLDQGGALERIVFIDNGSTDGSLQLVAERYPDVELLRSPSNLGYGGGNNLGIAWALGRGFDAVLIVNNDIVLPKGQLELLTRELERTPTAGLVGPRVLVKDDPTRIWAAGGRLTWRQNLTTLIGQGQLDGPRWQRTSEVDYVIGCAVLVRREVFERIGLFDAEYFAYTEDVDFGMRARRGGFTSRCVGEARALHRASSSTGGGYNPRRKYMMGVNSIWFLRRYAGPREWLQFFLFDVVSLPAVWLVGLFRGEARAVAAKAWGILDGLRGRRIRAEVLRNGANWLW